MYVYANETTITASPTGGVVRIKRGEAWAADDPLVKARPGLFSNEPPTVRRTAAPVEQATAAPGEKRRRAK